MARACEVFKEQDKSEVPLNLALLEADNTIFLAVVDENGLRCNQGSILKIDKKTGQFTRVTCLSDQFGLDLDERGRIVIG